LSVHHAVMRLMLTNTLRAISCGLDWPFTHKPREKRLTASSRQ
jgi:hypothetical protein